MARQFLTSKAFKEFIENNPQFSYEFVLQRGKHPYVSGLYINGFVKDLPLIDKEPEDIMYGLTKFRNTCKDSRADLSWANQIRKTRLESDWHAQ